MVDLHTIEWMSHKPEEFHMITEEVHEIVKNSPVKNGAVLVLTAHTTTGIMVNEGLPCVERDILQIPLQELSLSKPIICMPISCQAMVQQEIIRQVISRVCYVEIIVCSRWLMEK